MADERYTFLEAAAKAAREESRRYWAANTEKRPRRRKARFWPLHKPLDRGDCINPRAVRVLLALHELLFTFHDLDAVEALIKREIERIPT